ncbi:peroxidase-like [Pollicipes pollicipes]|uniref:peroxidase-like n=1 Tax=Pollicipes pollicipes TaxID=41117 RepID=UPI0018857DD4|nr:peroxidase-like [Pollicipes pollicipes]
MPLLECKELLEEEPIVDPFAAGRLCTLSDGSVGVLCGSSGLISRFGGPQAAAPSPSIFFPGEITGSKGVFDLRPLKNRLKDRQELVISNLVQKLSVVAEAKKRLEEVGRVVNQLAQRGANRARARSPESLQLLFSRPQSSEAERSAEASLQSVEVLTKLKEMRAVGSKAFSAEAPLFGVGLQDRANFPAFPVLGDDKIPGCEVPARPNCAGSGNFRTFNGECNNQDEPRLGRAQTAFSRFFPAEYEDGIFKPRSSGLGGPLPSARLVSQRVANTSPRDDNFRTLSVMLFGQFINHDMISTAAFTVPGGGGLACCNSDNSFPDEPLHPIGCNPIRVPDDDPFYSQFGRKCMSQVRSQPAPFEDCIAGPTNQLNQVSQFLDSSNIYGSSKEQADRLRAFTGGLIKSSDGNLLPQVGGRFISGEGRLSENPGLAFMHTIWTREHNRVAAVLAKNHRDWDDERLFQEARRIVNGEYQNVVYNEYLPTVLGFKYTRDHGLDPAFGHSFGYTGSGGPERYVQDLFILRSETGRILKTLAMEDTFFRPDLLTGPGVMAQFARALTRQKPRSVDNTFSASVHEKLFAQGAPSGLDLIALNINRGRDHGLPTYVTALENCLERSLDGEWSSLAPFFDPKVLQSLQSVYDSIYDIDLFIGGVAEKRKPGALVGEVFQCIIGEQFFVTRYGDRFFHDNGDMPHSLSFRQVREIQQSSWARILCDNIQGLQAVQPLALWQPSVFFNSLRDCNSFAIPRADLSVF